MLTEERAAPGRASERGASAVEYGLLVLLIAAAIVGILFVLGPDVTSLFQDTQTSLEDASSP